MIEETIKKVIVSLAPSSGDNLLGMDIDICHYFNSSSKLKFGSITRSNDPTCMFVIDLEATENNESLTDVCSALITVWEKVAYHYFAAHSINKFKTKSVLRFVTVIGDKSFYVTGKAVISGKQYENLAKEYEANFSELPMDSKHNLSLKADHPPSGFFGFVLGLWRRVSA